MKQIRRWHLYLSCFFAPLLVFYVATGWYQTFTANRNKSVGEQEGLIAKLTSIHVDSIYPADFAQAFSPKLFQWLVALMSICLLITVVLGIVLAFRSTRKTWPVWVALVLGIVVPVITLALGLSR